MVRYFLKIYTYCLLGLDLLVLAGVTWSQNKMRSLTLYILCASSWSVHCLSLSVTQLSSPTAQFHRDPVSAVESYHQDDVVIILPGVYSVSSTIVLPDSITIEGKSSLTLYVKPMKWYSCFRKLTNKNSFQIWAMLCIVQFQQCVVCGNVKFPVWSSGFGFPDDVVIEKKNKGDSFVESTGVDVKLRNIKFIQHDAIEGILCEYNVLIGHLTCICVWEKKRNTFLFCHSLACIYKYKYTDYWYNLSNCHIFLPLWYPLLK